MTSLFRKLTWLLRRRRKESELEEELQSHLDEEAKDRQAAGLSPEEAYRAARLELGNVTLLREDTRAVWSWMSLERLARELRDAIRLLRRDIPINVAILVVIAMAMTANTTMFSIANGVFLNFPIPDPERVFVINETHSPDFQMSLVSPGNFLEWQKANTLFQSMDAFRDQPFTLLEDRRAETVQGALVTTSYFATMGFKPQLGRGISREEDRPGRSDVVVISSRLWARRFDSDPNIVGRRINIDSTQRTVIGVMDFDLEEMDLWLPMTFNAAARDNRSSHNLAVSGRLKPQGSSEEALAELKQIARRLETAYPGTNRGRSVALTPIAEGMKAMVYLLLLLSGAAGFVLLIACANIANLQLARSISRRREVAIRMAIGATRFQIIRQLLAESIVLALTGGAAGLLLTYCGVRVLSTLGSDLLPITTVRMDPILLGFTALLSAIAGVLFGLAPALELSRSSLGERVKDRARNASASRGHRRTQNALIAAQVSVSLALLIGAGLMARSFVNLSSMNPGFNATNVLAAEVTLPERKYADPDQARRFAGNAIQQISSIPGIIAVAASHVLPFSSHYTYGVILEDQPAATDNETPPVSYYAVSPQYFDVLEIPLKRGRTFSNRDGVGYPQVAIVNETFASLFFPTESPVGKRIQITSGRGSWREIVGVVGDTKQQFLGAAPTPQVYEPLDQMPFSSMNFLVKTTGHTMSRAALIQERIQNIDPEQPVTIRTLQEIVKESVFPVDIVMIFLAVFAAAALLIALTGLYCVVAYLVSQRTREIGIRMALGADRSRVLAEVLREGMIPVAIGLILGIAAAFALGRVLQPLLFQTSATDVLTYTGLSFILAAASLLACYIPARRALKVDPMVTLRHE